MIHFDISKLETELSALEEQSSTPEFWNDTKNNSIILKQITAIKSKIDKYKKVKSNLESIIETNELIKLEYDEDLEKEIGESVVTSNNALNYEYVDEKEIEMK